MTTPKIHIGSISHGTLRTEDLLPAFIDELTRLGGTLPGDLECVKHMEYTNLPSYATSAPEDEDNPFWQSEDAMWDMEALTDALQECCPPFVYFGAHPGDGSDFGFWPDMEALEEALRFAHNHGDVTAVRGEKVIRDCTCEDCNHGILVQVNDHGNVPVMDMDRNELWSCV